VTTGPMLLPTPPALNASVGESVICLALWFVPLNCFLLTHAFIHLSLSSRVCEMECELLLTAITMSDVSLVIFLLFLYSIYLFI
jgi:hypothetical protein